MGNIITAKLIRRLFKILINIKQAVQLTDANQYLLHHFRLYPLHVLGVGNNSAAVKLLGNFFNYLQYAEYF